mgnify:CR=1 FL=1|jgi:hypothetical protein
MQEYFKENTTDQFEELNKMKPEELTNERFRLLVELKKAAIKELEAELTKLDKAKDIPDRIYMHFCGISIEDGNKGLGFDFLDPIDKKKIELIFEYDKLLE